jgi:3-hydroxyisobutyrate dehydrogenase-like beta-hydroxyacid dehydrogenase
VTESAGVIGFVGIGNMGGAMAARVLATGGSVIACDRSPDACARLAAEGALIVDTPAAVAERCPVVSVVVNTDDQVSEAVLGPDGVLAAAPPGAIVAIHSTIHLDTLEAVAAAAAARSVGVVDAAVTGGVDAARRGELAVLLGGDAASTDAVGSALAPYASLVLRAGELGAGMAAKIALMVVAFGKLAAVHEGLLLAQTAGVDVQELARVIEHSEAQSGITPFFLHARAGALATGDDHLARIGRHEEPKAEKDLHAALDLAARLGVDLPLTRVAHDEMPAVWDVAG